MRADGESRQQYEIRMAAEERFAAWRKVVGDSRCKDRTITVPSPIGQVIRLYCLNCGARGGAVTPDIPDAVYICRDCASRYGGLPMPEVPKGLILDNPEEGP